MRTEMKHLLDLDCLDVRDKTLRPGGLHVSQAFVRTGPRSVCKRRHFWSQNTQIPQNARLTPNQ